MGDRDVGVEAAEDRDLAGIVGDVGVEVVGDLGVGELIRGDDGGVVDSMKALSLLSA